MKPPIPLPYGEPEADDAKIMKVVSGFVCMLAVLCSSALIWLSQDALFWCFGMTGSCGTPCATASFELLIAPIIFTLPFINILRAKSLSTTGLIARCAVTSGIGVWVVTFFILLSKGFIL